MYLKVKYFSSSLIFVFLFVSQQIIAFTYSSYSLVSFYWLVITGSIFFIGLKLPLLSSVDRQHKVDISVT